MGSASHCPSMFLMNIEAIFTQFVLDRTIFLISFFEAPLSSRLGSYNDSSVSLTLVLLR